MSRELTLACVQISSTMADVEANLEMIETMTEEASGKGAELVIFPELALTGYNQDLLGEDLVNLATDLDGEPIKELANTARTYGVFLVVGFLERREIPGVVFNSIALIQESGSVVGSYAKSHLFSAENLNFREGQSIEVVPTEFGILGPMICMDIGYPEVARVLSLQGAELLIAPSAWIEEDEDIWPLLLQSRALDNLAFVAGVNHVGSEGNLNYIGKSMVVGPRGRIIQSLGAEEGVLVTTIDLDEVAAARRRAPRFTLRRPEMYGPISDATS